MRLPLGLGLTCTAWCLGLAELALALLWRWGVGQEELGGAHLAWTHPRFVSAEGTSWRNEPNILCTAADELVCPPFRACRRFGPIYDYELQPATHEKGRTDQWGCVRLGPGGVPGLDALWLPAVGCAALPSCRAACRAAASPCQASGGAAAAHDLPAVAADLLSPPSFRAAAL